MTNRSAGRSAYTALDLFAGAGGFTLGLEEAGFTSIGSIEIDPTAATTLAMNFGARLVDFHGPDTGDISKISVRRVRDALRRAAVNDLDLLTAAPPCQGFSRVGRAKLDSLRSSRGSFAEDSRNSLYEHATRLLSSIRPRAFVFENVSGILHLRGHNVAEDVCDAISRAGYRVRYTLLNAAWYGVPQTRERVIIVGYRSDLGIDPAFPMKRFHAKLSRGHLTDANLNRRNWRNPDFFVDPRELGAASPLRPALTVGQALEDLPRFTQHLASMNNGRKYRSLRDRFPPSAYRRPPRNWYCAIMRAWNASFHSSVVTDHFCRWTPRDFETFAEMRPGDRFPEAIEIAERRYAESLERYRKHGGARPRRADFVPPYDLDSFPEKWRKLISTKPSWTVTAHLGKDTYSHIHFDSSQARSITIREAARLQSFPDAFRFAGNMGDAFRQIGNAVPPLLAREIGLSVRAQLAKVDGRRIRPMTRPWDCGWTGMRASR